MMDAIELRKYAIDLFLNGESKTEIAKKTGKTRQWVHKGIKRNEAGADGNWSESLSRAPLTSPHRTAHGLEQEILGVRTQLEATKYAQIGAISIQYEFASRGGDVPATWTINRVLKRNGKVKAGKAATGQKKIIPSRIARFTRWTLSARGTSREPTAFTA